jgi:hypothetical protein
MASAKGIFLVMSSKLLQSSRKELGRWRTVQLLGRYASEFLAWDKRLLNCETHRSVQIHNYSAPELQIRGLGMIMGTEFTNNKSPTDLFPAEWGKSMLQLLHNGMACNRELGLLILFQDA